MHICFITSEYPKIGFPHGGVGSFIKTIAPELSRNNIKVSVVGINYSNVEEIVQENGVEIYRLKSKKIKGLSWYLNAIAINKKIKQIHKENPISIIESAELDLAFLNKINTIKYLIRLHGGHHFFAESENRGINFWKGFQEKRSFKKADAFIAVSKYVKLHTQKYLSFNNKSVTILNNPINISLFSPLKATIQEDSIVFVGTVCEKKGIRQLIQAFPFVKKRFPKAILSIYGRDWFFPNGKSFIEMLKETELPKLGAIANDITFHGTIDFLEIPKKYAQAGVCVFPSHMETQGLVAPEAMAMEKMVIFTKLGPGPETIIDFETGLLCDPYNANDIAEKIIWVFDNKQKAEVIGKKAREFVIEKYELYTITKLNIEFYKYVIATN